MMPTLHPGDVLVLRTLRQPLPDVGALVVVHDPARPGRRLVKRVASQGRATFSVSSDNPLEGRDSRQFGSLQAEQVVGCVAWVLPLGDRR
jgi:phage repressor protein C with HTH and peptisase S24 domain